MQTTKCFIFLAVIVIVFAVGYGSNKRKGGRMDGGYESGHKFGPFSYGYHDHHGNFLNVDGKHPHQIHYEYGFKAGGDSKSEGGYGGKSKEKYGGGYGKSDDAYEDKNGDGYDGESAEGKY